MIFIIDIRSINWLPLLWSNFPHQFLITFLTTLNYFLISHQSLPDCTTNNLACNMKRDISNSIKFRENSSFFNIIECNTLTQTFTCNHHHFFIDQFTFANHCPQSKSWENIRIICLVWSDNISLIIFLIFKGTATSKNGLIISCFLN